MYTDAGGNIYQSYEQAVIMHGGETETSLAWEDAFYMEMAQEEANQEMDAMEARGGPRYQFAYQGNYPIDDTDPF
ncbi:MAG: hypothetical protein Unbinned3065contig1002_23 [Prokaryotic dsDNA virus sp.]|nr:MAG: hypothetical protein Unbinned3065contig1002_23 [Prokaryotic dsDNA virus sp.]|tara:strand:- start:1873 stop:2097 length:225 start_codon:yes stop_codon:yes gene_type:complete